MFAVPPPTMLLPGADVVVRSNLAKLSIFWSAIALRKTWLGSVKTGFVIISAKQSVFIAA